MMDISIVIQPFLQLWWLFAIAFIVFFFKQPFGKGLLGETLINLTLKLGLDENKYRLLKDVTLPTDDGTTQIDHIVVSQHGIFVIETKNMKGWIFGSENQRYWTQNIYGKKHTLQNPLHQNYKHTKTIEKILDISPDKIFSVVVFVGDAEFKTDMPDNVIYAGALLNYIKSKDNVLLTQREVEGIVSAIEYGKLTRSRQR